MDGTGLAAWRTLLDRHAPRRVETSFGAFSIREAGIGPDIVLVHGIGSGSGSWIHQLDLLSDAFHVIAWDAPGYGNSDPLPECAVSADSYADRLVALLTEVAMSQAVLVGHSLGALIAARFALRRPEMVAGLVLADPAAGHSRLPEPERRQRRAARMLPFETLGPVRYAEERAPNLLAPGADPEKLALVCWNMQRLGPRGLADAAELLSGGDLARDVAGFEGPALVICGALDRVTPPAGCRAIADGFPSPAAYREIPGAGHASPIDAPESFARLVRDFAERCT